jgi:hypothetical protein
MNCQVCRKVIPKRDLFCMNCGTRKPTEVPASNIQSQGESQEQFESKGIVEDPLNLGPGRPSRVKSSSEKFEAHLRLRTPVPLRWLVQIDYGTLTLGEEHLTYSLRPEWTYPIWRILAQIICLGLDPLSLARINGQIHLRNLGVAAVVRPKWFKWQLCNLFFIAGILPLNFWVTNHDNENVREFVRSVKIATSEAKYVTEMSNGK